MSDAPDKTGVIACPSCGFSHLRGSQPHTLAERFQAWWTGTSFFRCQTCNWRGPLHDEWNASSAFPHVPPLRLGRELDIEPLEQRDEQTTVDLLLAHADRLGCTLRVWLDDSRPAPAGWLHLRSVGAVQALLSRHLVRELSLDHDLGWCAACIREGAHLRNTHQRHCPHTPTGYDLCVWMANTGLWPPVPPAVHSGNLEGGARMLGLIARRWVDPAVAAADAPAGADPSPAVDASLPEPEALPDRDYTAMSQLTTCPACGARRVIRVTRGTSLARLRAQLTRRNPVRCQACGWAKWVKDPILVRLSSSRESTPEELSRTEFDAIDPDQ